MTVACRYISDVHETVDNVQLNFGSIESLFYHTVQYAFLFLPVLEWFWGLQWEVLALFRQNLLSRDFFICLTAKFSKVEV